MRRIHLGTLALGLVAVLGITIVQAAAEPAKSPYGGRKGNDPVVVPTEFAIPKLPDKPGDKLPERPPEPMPDIVLPPTLPDLNGPSLALPGKPDEKPAAPAIKTPTEN